MWKCQWMQAVCGSWKHCKNFEGTISKSFKCLECTLHKILNYVVDISDNFKGWEKKKKDSLLETGTKAEI